MERTLELATNLREVFTVMEKAPTTYCVYTPLKHSVLIVLVGTFNPKAQFGAFSVIVKTFAKVRYEL